MGLSLPGISNQELMSELLHLDQGVKVLLVTGHPMRGSSWMGAAEVLLKPFNTNQLLQRVRHLLDS